MCVCVCVCVCAIVGLSYRNEPLASIRTYRRMFSTVSPAINTLRTGDADLRF